MSSKLNAYLSCCCLKFKNRWLEQKLAAGTEGPYFETNRVQLNFRCILPLRPRFPAATGLFRVSVCGCICAWCLSQRRQGGRGWILDSQVVTPFPRSSLLLSSLSPLCSLYTQQQCGTLVVLETKHYARAGERWNLLVVHITAKYTVAAGLQ